MSRAEATIPMPAAGTGAAPGVEGSGVAALVAAFVEATARLPVDAAAHAAGVRRETILKWRRRLPRWLKAGTARRLAAYLAGQPPAPMEEDGFRRAFRVRLRPVPAE